ncbi:MAG: transglycosylase family protein [Propioniciclava sp.]|uniref:transglycosylase family protein n=1 Tax=Propioniciclava sp. TaxID=2038686 RepID=UPI0039E6BC25
MTAPRIVARTLATTTLAGAIALAGVVAAPQAQAWDVAVWDRVAKCESGGNWSINTGNGYYGGLQFSASTWRAYGGTQYASHAHKATKAQQIAIARRTLQGQGPGAWPVCSRKAGLTRANGGADRNAQPSGGSSSSGTPSRSAERPSGSLSVTGRLDKATVAAMQRWVGSTPDGVWGPKTTRALQAKVGVRVTGVRNAETTRAVQRLVGTKVDGKWGSQTTRALQNYLNGR